MRPPLPTATDASRHAWRCAAIVAAALLPANAAAIATATNHAGSPQPRAQHYSHGGAAADVDSHARALTGIDYEDNDDYYTFYYTDLGVKYKSANRGRSNPWDYEVPDSPAAPSTSTADPKQGPAASRADVEGRPPAEPDSPGENWDYEYEPLTYEEEIEAVCTVEATTEEVENFSCGSVHANAVAEVFKMVCDGKADLVLEDLEEIFMAEDAVAFAQATATAMVECTSDDEDAFLCASVSVSSEAFANTTVAAHVSAMATALDGCACMGSSISSFITAEAFISLVAEATATATASACISGRGRVVDEVYETCSTSVFARVFARAAAEAIIEGECLDAEASAGLLVEANAVNITAGSTCGGLAVVTVDGVPVPPDS